MIITLEEKDINEIVNTISQIIKIPSRKLQFFKV